MADGALSWLAMVAARMLAEGAAPQRGELELAGGLACYRPYRCADGWVTLGALEPKFWQAFCRGVGREDLIERHLDPSGVARPSARSRRSSRAARATSGPRSRASTTAASSRCWASTRRSTRSSCARARWWSRSTSPAPSARCGCSASRSSSRARRATRARAPGPALGQDTEAVLAALGYAAEEIAGLVESGAVAGPAGESVRGSFMG